MRWLEAKPCISRMSGPVPANLPDDQKRLRTMQALGMLIDNMIMQQFLEKQTAPVNPAEVTKRLTDLESGLKEQGKSMAEFLRDKNDVPGLRVSANGSVHYLRRQTPEQKARYLQPLLEGEVFSSYSMTEPQAGSDPKQFTCRAVRDGDDWVLSGWKYFSSNARTSAFLIVMAVWNIKILPV